MKKRVFFLLLLASIFTFTASAHPGNTDANGGHSDFENKSGLGSYHYHHGYPAHLHEDGKCIYLQAEKVVKERYLANAAIVSAVLIILAIRYMHKFRKKNLLQLILIQSERDQLKHDLESSHQDIARYQSDLNDLQSQILSLQRERNSLREAVNRQTKQLALAAAKSEPRQELPPTPQIEPPNKLSDIDIIRSQPHVIALESKLQQYMSRPKNEAETGKEYERYVGYKYEMQGCLVDYRGIRKGRHDLGCDLLVRTNNEFLIVQCKCWRKHSIIREKYVLQLHGTVSLYKEKHPKASVSGILITTATLSADAKESAKRLGIKYQENFDFKEHPMVKCIHIGANKKYFLPYDPAYDKIYFSQNQGDRYVESVAEAELFGFHY